MNLKVFWNDMRGGYTGGATARAEVIDEESGREVGFVEASRSPIARHISLFGGKYQGNFRTHEECLAFAKGVEAVLNHSVELPSPATVEAA